MKEYIIKQAKNIGEKMGNGKIRGMTKFKCLHEKEKLQYRVKQGGRKLKNSNL